MAEVAALADYRNVYQKCTLIGVSAVRDDKKSDQRKQRVLKTEESRMERKMKGEMKADGLGQCVT